jgi:hypothetical protein
MKYQLIAPLFGEANKYDTLWYNRKHLLAGFKFSCPLRATKFKRPLP